MESRTRIGWLQLGAIGVVALFVVGAIMTGGPHSASTVVTETFVTRTAPRPPAPTASAGQKRLAVLRVAQEQGLDKGIAVAAAVGETDLKTRFQRRAAQILERRARRAFDGGRYATALRVARTARRRYGSAAAAAPAIRAMATQALTERGAIVTGR